MDVGKVGAGLGAPAHTLSYLTPDRKRDRRGEREREGGCVALGIETGMVCGMICSIPELQEYDNPR